MALNLSSLTVVEDVEIPEARRGRTPAENPMVPFMQKSINEGVNGTGRNLAIPSIPAAETRELVNLLRYAATALNVGARIYLSAENGQEVTLGRKENEDGSKTGLDIVYKASPDTPYEGNVNVSYRSQKRKQKKAEAATDTADETTGETGDVIPADVESTSEDVTAETTETPAETPKRRRR